MSLDWYLAIHLSCYSWYLATDTWYTTGTVLYCTTTYYWATRYNPGTVLVLLYETAAVYQHSTVRSSDTKIDGRVLLLLATRRRGGPHPAAGGTTSKNKERHILDINDDIDLLLLLLLLLAAAAAHRTIENFKKARGWESGETKNVGEQSKLLRRTLQYCTACCTQQAAESGRRSQ